MPEDAKIPHTFNYVCLLPVCPFCVDFVFAFHHQDVVLRSLGVVKIHNWKCAQGSLVFEVSKGFDSNAWYHHVGDCVTIII